MPDDTADTTAPAARERVVRTYFADVYCASCDWTTWTGGQTEGEVVAYLETRLRAHVRRWHAPTRRPS